MFSSLLLFTCREISLQHLQKTVMDNQSHFSEQGTLPLEYFNALVMTLQFERAIDFLVRSPLSISSEAIPQPVLF